MKTTSGKILASAALVGTAAAVAGMGTYGAFTGSTSADQQVTAGSVAIELGGASNTLSVAVADLLPGDSVEKFVTLANNGSDLNGVTLTTATSTPSLLTTDTTNGLKLTVERCSTAWTAVANGPDTCEGSLTSLGVSPIIGTGRSLANLASLSAAGSDYLKITTTLPGGATNDFQSLSSTVSFTFDATQRTGTVR